MKCYICHKEIGEAHHHYERMCLECGNMNLEKRNEFGNLLNYNALVTGGRIKIGYQTALKLLRSGAFVVITTRFPVDAVKRYSEETDFNEWYNRLRIFKIDFRNLPYINELIKHLYEELPSLDILINNAAQTIRRSYEYYRHLEELEKRDYESLPQKLKELICNKSLNFNFKEIQESSDSFLPFKSHQLTNGQNIEMSATYYPIGMMDEDGIQIDNSPINSWIKRAEEISMIEMLEVQLVNVTAPFILNTALKKLMEKSDKKFKHIINVSAMEGKFSKKNKNCFHPHTNMAKAALNMFTRTSAQDYLKSGIIVNCVDTGWVTDENPTWIRNKNIRKGLFPPLDSLDGAARICDPIFNFVHNSQYNSGQFLKDFKPTNW